MNDYVTTRRYFFVPFLCYLSTLILSIAAIEPVNITTVNITNDIPYLSPVGSLHKSVSLEDESLNLLLNSNNRLNMQSIPNVMHKNAIRAARKLLRSGRCNHVYLDIGTNVGIQIRKFFQPQSYPKSILWPPIWDKYFGKYDMKTNNRTDTCVFGFEPNPMHSNTLRKTEKYYQKNGFPIVIFRETAVTTTHGNATFIRDLISNPIHQEWGGTMLDHGNTLNRQSKSPQIRNSTFDVFTLDISKFISIEIASRQGQTSKSKVVAKLDVEGAEYTVLPTMLAQSNGLCSISYISIEWHNDFLGSSTAAPETNSLTKILNFITQQAKGCGTIITNIEDEAYSSLGADTVSLDLNTPM